VYSSTNATVLEYEYSKIGVRVVLENEYCIQVLHYCSSTTSLLNKLIIVIVVILIKIMLQPAITKRLLSCLY